MVGFVEAQNWSEAAEARKRVVNLLQEMTGLATLYDYTKNAPYKTGLVDKFLTNKEVQKALGVNGPVGFESCSALVGAALHEDMMKSVKFMVEELLAKKMKVLLYQGQYDLRGFGAVATEAWVKTMKWEGIDEFSSADRRVWKMGKEVAGYVQKWGSLSQVLVAGAGHLVPADQPLRAQAMIEDWVLDKGSFSNANAEEVNFLSSS